MIRKETYIEDSNKVIKDAIRGWMPGIDLPIAIPNIGDDSLVLSKPTIFIEFNNSMNIDKRIGKRNGRGKNVKRKLLNYSILVITTGDNRSILERDRITQTIESNCASESISNEMARLGAYNIDCRFVNAYKVREGINLARLSLNMEIRMVD